MKQLLTTVYLFFFCSFLLNGQFPDYVDVNKHTTLLSGAIHNVIKDKKGFMWFATSTGLYKYDGYSFTHFASHTSNKNSLLNQNINQLIEDRSGNIWIDYKQINGLTKFNIEREQFTHYFSDKARGASLSDDFITQIYLDKSGNVWIGTSNGLNLYIEKRDIFVKFFNKDSVKDKFHDNYVYGISEDSAGIIWTATSKGYRYLTIASQEEGIIRDFDIFLGCIAFCRGYIDAKNNLRLKVFQDKDNYLWFSNGLYVFKTNQKVNKNIAGYTYKQYGINQKVQSKQKRYSVTISQANNGNIWIGTNVGLVSLKREGNEEISEDYFTNPENYNPGGYNLFNYFYKAVDGKLWAYNEDNIYVLDKSGAFRAYKSDSKDPTYFSNNHITCLYIDNNNILWVGTINKGVELFNLSEKSFVNYSWFLNDYINHESKEVYAVYLDSLNVLWVGTQKGLSIINRNNGKTKHLNQRDGLLGRIVGVIKPDHDFFWLGYYDIKISKYFYKSNTIKNYGFNSGKTNEFPQWSLRDIYTDSKGTVWFSQCSATLTRLNKDGSFTSFNIESENVRSPENIGFKMLEDQEKNFWIATSSTGLVLFDREKGKPKEIYTYNPEDPASISDNEVHTILEDGPDKLWVGTTSGLNLFNKRTRKFTRINISGYFASNYIRGILGDDHDNLWISTNYGLFRFNKTSKKIKQYTIDDGLASDEYCDGAYFKSKQGEMFFGGMSGLTSFFPDSIKENPVSPITVFTALNLFNKQVFIDQVINGSIVLKKSISYTKSIVLSHRQNDFSIEFAGLNYINAPKNVYRYQLQGYDQEWREALSSQRIAYYSNLKAGTYTFKVKAANPDGIWDNTGAALKITILPPFWHTWWFKMLIIFLLIFSLIAYNGQRNRVLNNRRIILEKLVRLRTQEVSEQKEALIAQSEKLMLQKEEIQVMANNLHKADEEKISFFMNISHEFKTPLTLIIAPIEKRLHAIEETVIQKAELSLIYRNSKRLLNLINQLLEIRKIETGKMQLHYENTDIIEFSKGIASLFEPLALKNNIRFLHIMPQKAIRMFFDHDILEKILYNLLSNAFNYTPLGGTITLKISEGSSDATVELNNVLFFSVADSGPGIPADKHESIFDGTFEGPENRQYTQKGSGLGLPYTKQIVEKHQGKISLISEPGNGSVFIVSIPILKFVTDTEFIIKETEIQNEILNTDSTSAATKLSFEKSIILIIDDNQDILELLTTELKDDYAILKAEDGKNGLVIAQEHLPDLIISDIMMPEMNGIELCNIIKSDKLTNHIPVLLLTAKSGESSQISGLNSGADDYIMKPFSIQVLKLKIRNIIDHRNVIISKFSKRITANLDELDLDSASKVFLGKFHGIIDGRIDDSELDVEYVAGEFCMSSRHLQRKLKTITGKSFNNYVRNYRIIKSVELLRKGETNISTVAYNMGFSSPGYYTRSFREVFEVSPSEYIDKLREDNK